MSRVIRVSDELAREIEGLKLEKNMKKRGRPSIWNTDMNDWEIRLVYKPKKKM